MLICVGDKKQWTDLYQNWNAYSMNKGKGGYLFYFRILFICLFIVLIKSFQLFAKDNDSVEISLFW